MRLALDYSDTLPALRENAGASERLWQYVGRPDETRNVRRTLELEASRLAGKRWWRGRALKDAAACLLLLALGGLVGAIFFGRFRTPAFLGSRLLSPLAASLLVLLAALAIGVGSFVLVRRLFAWLGRLSSPATTVRAADLDLLDCLLIGVPAYGTLLAIIALSGLALEVLVLLLTLACAVPGALILWKRRSRTWPALSAWQVGLLAPPVLLALLGALAPVTSPDELIYKLALPRTYYLFGEMVELPLNSHSYFAAALSLSSLGALMLSGGVAAKLVHFFVYLLALRVVYRLSERISPGGGPWLSAVTAWTPALMLIAGWGWPDWGVIGLLLLSYEGWSRFRAEPTAGHASLCFLALAGALASKYTALPWLLAFAAVAAFGLRRIPIDRFRFAGLAAVVLLLFGGFFYLRNLLWTGSPIAPFLLPDSPQVAHYKSGSPMSGWADLLRGRDVLDPGLLDDSLGILLPVAVLLSPLALAGARRGHSELFAMGASQFVFFVTFAPLSRLMTTALVPLGLLGAAVCAVTWLRVSRLWRALLGVLAGVALVGQFLLVAYIFVVSYDFFPYLVGNESEASYLLRTQPFVRPYAWIAARTPAKSKFFLIGENRTYYLDRRSIAAGNLDGPRMARYLSRFRNARALDEEMRSQGVTHILMGHLWYRVAGGAAPSPVEREFLVEVPAETDRVLQEYLSSHAPPVYSDPSYTIFALR